LGANLHWVMPQEKLMDSQFDPVGNGYRVEVSGWDTAENFFVEKTILDWGPGQKGDIRLRSALSEGTVVFLRLLELLEGSGTYPIACRVVKVVDKDADGRTWFQLEQVRPRAFFKETVRDLHHSAIRLA
jgi:hypothetical protein